ncbi:hypothetical protein DAPPUDRAFT_330286 [Daphnia pulex]|uniref:Uncharacterized protein n=1 Tax=Daphnia pulex TaxID=6669 RepID=E9HJ44_DAPPU|nr:hypothetical protein DAPPUDRAFT_330286 [Daphnia pulex]|eukprot:EFX68261.1 hypothetical protein DAPPUDRAFT_330286 [Daphnia pulex]
MPFIELSTVSFTVLPNTLILAKNWILSELGRKILIKELELPYDFPYPMEVASKLLRWEESSL